MRPLALSTAVFLTGTVAQNYWKTCYDGLLMIAARGTSEDQGPGVIGKIADAVAERINGSHVVGLDYPATLQSPDYEVSESQGVKTLQDILGNYFSKCPDNKVAVFGYSQGGQVATDVFCGGSGGDFPSNKPIAVKDVKKHVVAIITFGDPSHVANVSYNLGDSINDGIFQRNDTKLCEDNYSGILHAYCDTGDVYCDRGNDTEVHGSYFEKYGKKVEDLVVDSYESAVSESTATPTSEATTSATSASSATSATSEVTSTDAPGNSASGLVPGVVLAMAPLALALSQLL
ncbi:acetylxylan esterase 2 [Fusarium longipes]|uniref:Acetylxylan esterase 2 n=1 Tax=Fusarium longipes TaxID=694270 RepID=A0A395SRC9_9HYPO|nr:acetylxylan esterase 2 [Fusarium longipes]